MDDLSDLMQGMTIKKQHIYFNIAKSDICKLGEKYIRNEDYNKNGLYLPIQLEIIEVDYVNLNIVIKYINEYGYLLFEEYVKTHDLNIHTIDKSRYDIYINQYIDELNKCFKIEKYNYNTE